MHLSRQADGASTRELRAGGRAELRDRRVGRPPPVVGLLLGPERPRARDVQRRGGLRDHAIVLVREDGLHARGAEVDAEVHEGSFAVPPFGPDVVAVNGLCARSDYVGAGAVTSLRSGSPCS